jgi:oligosaccharyl transferase (archaeosortase A-associated)
LLIIFGIALALRVCLVYGNVFVGDGVRFMSVDPWYHIRLVENLVQHFPHLIGFDPFTLYPYGQEVWFAPLFDLLLGFFIWVIGMGSPTQYTIETVGAYFPAILGALVTIPVYFIGRELFNRNVGLLSAGLIAILPGQFLFRSLLGFIDHHIAEVLFSAITALFLILAIKRAKEREISFGQILSRDWVNLRKPLLYALLAGLALGIYLASWVGGLLFVFVIFAYVIVQYIIDHLRGKSTDYLCIIGVPMFLLALVVVIPFSNFLLHGGLVIASLVIGMLAFPALSGVSRLMASRKVRRAYYPLVLSGLALAAVGVLYAVDPSLLGSMVDRFSIFTPSAKGLTIGEVQTGLSITGFFRILYFFTTTIFLAITALVLIIRAQVKGGNAGKTFLIVWSIIMLLAMLGQNRFSYYFAVNVALLSGYLCWRILVWSYLIKARPQRKKGKRGEVLLFLGAFYPRVEAVLGRGYLSAKNARVAGVAVMVFLIAILPNIMVAMDVARETEGPNEAWYSSLVWMRDNTPDPFGDPDFYYEVYEKPPPGESYDYPESAYGIMNWWDYGHWITRIAHRIPNSNPFQSGARDTARFFTAQDESSANEVLDELGSKYVILDHDMANGKFYAIGIWAGESESKFMENYDLNPAEGEFEITMLYHPEYYRSMCSRLYNFGGEAVVPHNSTMVISYEEVKFLRSTIKQITGNETFATYEEALEYLESQTAPNYRIVGEDPFISPVPLEELEHYKLVYQSDPVVIEEEREKEEEEEEEEQLFYVKVFEHLP